MVHGPIRSIRVLQGFVLALSTFTCAQASASPITLPSAGGTGFSFYSRGASDDLIHFDAPFTGTMTFDYYTVEYWTIRSSPQYLAVGSCVAGTTSATCYQNGSRYSLPNLPYNPFNPVFAPMTWVLVNAVTLDFSYPPPPTSDVSLRNITLTLTPQSLPVPEPTTLLLAGAGCVHLICRRRQRRVDAASSTAGAWGHAAKPPTRRPTD